MSIRILTGDGKGILASDDSRRYFQGTGNVFSDYANNLECPFFVVSDPKYKNPFSLNFNKDTRSVTLTPGIVSLYGHLIEAPEETTVIEDMTLEYVDFFSKCYVYVFIHVDLDDVGDERATIVHSFQKTKGDTDAAYPESEDQDDMNSTGRGIYDIPVASFLYDPQSMGTDHMFTHVSYYRKAITPAEKEKASQVDNIGNSSADSILNQFLGNTMNYPTKAKEADTCLAIGTEGYCTPIDNISFWTVDNGKMLCPFHTMIAGPTAGQEYKIYIGPNLIQARCLYRFRISGKSELKFPNGIFDCSDGVPFRKGIFTNHAFTFTTSANEFYDGFTLGIIGSFSLTFAKYSDPILYCLATYGGMSDCIGLCKKYEEDYPEIRRKVGRDVEDPDTVFSVSGQGYKDFLFPICEIRFSGNYIFIKRNLIKAESDYGSSKRTVTFDPGRLLYGSGKYIYETMTEKDPNDSMKSITREATGSEMFNLYVQHIGPLPAPEEP